MKPILKEASGHPSLARVENYYRFQIVINNTDEPTLRAAVAAYGVPGFTAEFSVALYDYIADYKAKEVARGAFSEQLLKLRVREDDVRFSLADKMRSVAQANNATAVRAWRDAIASVTAGQGADIEAALTLCESQSVDVAAIRAKASLVFTEVSA